MKQQVTNVGQPSEGEAPVATTEKEEKEIYDLHVQLGGKLKRKIKDATELAYKMGDIEKPDLVDLMNLWIVQGIALLYRKWNERGYR